MGWMCRTNFPTFGVCQPVGFWNVFIYEITKSCRTVNLAFIDVKLAENLKVFNDHRHRSLKHTWFRSRAIIGFVTLLQLQMQAQLVDHSIKAGANESEWWNGLKMNCLKNSETGAREKERERTLPKAPNTWCRLWQETNRHFAKLSKTSHSFALPDGTNLVQRVAAAQNKIHFPHSQKELNRGRPPPDA